MNQQEWLIDEAMPPDAVAIEQMEREIGSSQRGSRESFSQPQAVNLAVRLQDIMIWDTKKWFGDAEMRLDALVVHGHATPGEAASVYMPKTFRFPGIKSQDRLPTGENGLLIFYGEALHFLDIFITVSRDRQDSEDLATLLHNNSQSPNFQGAVNSLLGLAGATPGLMAVGTAIGGASILGNLARQVLSKVTGNTIGLYHTSWLQYKDGFGIGRHPERASHNVKDLSFWYEIIREEPS
ncbi:hypothetical protein OGM63_20300 [Plectonema radiosum NIES-515]|uniref:Uncharacterized protein n=1 Tax=Plectonema radiosum NIES-515 TaxID=2986073 RepID=A0ABT3B379_9CYAN|nr:hypothetical protein [Plectonema radiosum]MCV3215819.1 hypothetical protein [Plectonema radiosum NIES-515]